MHTGKRLLVTVGSTGFTDLVLSVHTDEFYAQLRTAGFNQVVLQHGSSPLPVLRNKLPKDLAVETFAYKPSLHQDFVDATHIVCHAGTGSIMEGLSLRKPLLVVVNESLMDNHQMELAQELSSQKFIQMTTADRFRRDFDAFLGHGPFSEWRPVAPRVFLSVVQQELSR